MAINIYGIDPAIDESHWSQLLADVAPFPAVVPTGLVVTGGTARLFSISAGRAVVAGVLATVDATSVTLGANAAANPRIDVICLQVDWSGTQTTGGTIVVVSGTTTSTTPVAPTLTQTAGVRWQMPLARVIVRNGVTNVAAADLVVCKPLPRQDYVFAASSFATQITPTGADPQTIATVNLPDPGWPYRIRVEAAQRYQTNAGAIPGQGYALLFAYISGSELARGATDQMTPSTGLYVAQFVHTASAITSGPVVATLRQSAAVSAAATNDPSSLVNRFVLTQIPA